MHISPSQLGINIHLAGIRHFGLDEKNTIQIMLDLPYQHVRIPIPFDEIAPRKGVWDFSKRDYLLEQASKHNKTIHLQFGAKTIGWPEVWLPRWLTDTHPYIHKAHACIDEEKEVQEFLLQALAKTTKRYISLKNIGSIQIENEAFCRRLSVSNFRYISQEFHKKELAVLKKYNKTHIPILQNLPLNNVLDMFQALPYVFQNSDVIGLNIYNQHIASPILRGFNTAGLRIGLPLVKGLSFLTKKQLYVTELQTAPWLSGGKSTTKFSEKAFRNMIYACLKNNTKIVFLWDIEQILSKGSDMHKNLLTQLVTNR